MIVVSNTSPLIALSKINQFAILKKLFKVVWIPQAVQNEFLQNCTLFEEENFSTACQDCIKIVEVPVLSQIKFSRRLGSGEQEALTLTIQKQADILIIDDRKAFNEASYQKLTAVSTRAVLRIAAESKIIADSQTLETALKNDKFFLPNY
jgi:predicted nucleic acid-binding protein